MRQITLVTIHPDIVAAYARFGVLRAAQDKGLASVHAVDLRDYAVDRHGSVDDSPYGGGDGMVMRPEPLAAAIAALGGRPKGSGSDAAGAPLPDGTRPRVLLTTPGGQPWNHAAALRFAAITCPVVIVCGRFAGVDQRFIDHYVDEEYSVGDVVLAGGELPALMMTEAMLRLMPGVLGHQDSAVQDSFASGCGGGLEHPLYTRPAAFEGQSVPPVLMSGDHKKIAAWRESEALRRTAAQRPDLLPTATRRG